MPKVTIGVPVLNGGQLIEECLSNLASQDFDDFEVLISDNGSSDETAEICARFAEKDARFRVMTRAETVPALENFEHLLASSDSQFFLWRAHDDLSSPDYLSGLTSLLECDPRARLAVGHVEQFRMASGRRRELPYPVDDNTTGSEDRILTQMLKGHASWIYGIWRRDACQAAFDRVLAQYPDPWGGDHLVVLHAILNDGLRGLPSTTFVQRLPGTPRHYVRSGSGKKESYDVMIDRNHRFHRLSDEILCEADLPARAKDKIKRQLPRYVHAKCHGRKRLFQAWARKVRGT